MYILEKAGLYTINKLLGQIEKLELKDTKTNNLNRDKEIILHLTGLMFDFKEIENILDDIINKKQSIKIVWNHKYLFLNAISNYALKTKHYRNIPYTTSVIKKEYILTIIFKDTSTYPNNAKEKKINEKPKKDNKGFTRKILL